MVDDIFVVDYTLL